MLILGIPLVATMGIRATVGNHSLAYGHDDGLGRMILKAKIASAEDGLFRRFRRGGC